MDPTELLVGGVVGAAASAVITYFTLNSKAKTYIRDAMGKNEEIDVNVSQPLVIKGAPTYAGKDETEKEIASVKKKVGEIETHFDSKIESMRRETKDEFDKVRSEATNGRRLIHEEIRRSGEKIGDKILDLTNSVGELNGQIRGMK
jgi:hypothetical protein